MKGYKIFLTFRVSGNPKVRPFNGKLLYITSLSVVLFLMLYKVALGL